MGKGRYFSSWLSLLEIFESTTEVSNQDLCSLIEEHLSSLVDSLISESRHILDDMSDGVIGMPVGFLEEISKRSGTSR